MRCMSIAVARPPVTRWPSLPAGASPRRVLMLVGVLAAVLVGAPTIAWAARPAASAPTPTTHVLSPMPAPAAPSIRPSDGPAGHTAEVPPPSVIDPLGPPEAPAIL